MNDMKKHRELKGLKQIDIAKVTNLSRASISLFESGKSTPSMNSAFKIAQALDVTVDELFSIESEKQEVRQ